MIGKVKVAIQPMLQRQIDEHVRGLRHEYRLLDRIHSFISLGVGGLVGGRVSGDSNAIETREAASGDNDQSGWQKHCVVCEETVELPDSRTVD